jgi:hypothetical protein
LEGSSAVWLGISTAAYVRLTQRYRSEGIGLVDEPVKI